MDLHEKYCFSDELDLLIALPHSVEPDDTGQITLVPFGSLESTFSPAPSLEHTADHRNCPACVAANESLQGIRVNFAHLTLREAAARWTALREQSLSLHARTHETTQDYLNALGRFFGGLRLCDITPGHLRQYQIARLHNSILIQGQEKHPWKRPCGHSIINHELSVLSQILRHCRLWQRLEPFYFPLSLKHWSPRTILTEADEERLFSIAARHPEAALAYWVATITNNTTAAGIELRGLRLKHVFLPETGIGEICIPEDAVKNTSRPRKLPLNQQARWAVEQCLKRALKLGCCEPDHFLFPFRIKRNLYDPTRQVSRFFLRKSWARLRAATGFDDLKPHDLRHHCITRLLENDVNPETVIAIAGHVSRRMLEYYAHQRTRVKYAAVLQIEPKKTQRGLNGRNFSK